MQMIVPQEDAVKVENDALEHRIIHSYGFSLMRKGSTDFTDYADSSQYEKGFFQTRDVQI